jgi:hypothetical protein
VEPSNPAIDQVLAPISGQYDRVLGENGVYVPTLPPAFNTLHELHAGEGYYLRYTGSTGTVLPVSGTQAAAGAPLILHDGWNWIGYLPESALPVPDALSSIEGDYVRVLSLDKAYDPSLPQFSTLQQMGPGEGYLIRVVGAQTLAYPSGQKLERFGAGLQPNFGAISDYDVASLHIGWYSDWSTQVNPARPNGIEYAQLIWVSEGVVHPSLATLGAMVSANPGSLWMVGNEPECIWQGNNTPQQYAEAYHQVYTHIKGLDPTARVAIGGVVQPTPLRLQWLDLVLSHYQASYGSPMPVDVWNIHIQILQELRDSWGAEIPRGLSQESGRLYTIQDNDSIQIFQQLIVEFRTWMQARGQRDKPLIISEYGVLMPVEYGFTPARVNAFMDASFDYLLSAQSGSLGYPADENRLVQRWLWYSLNEQPYNLYTGEGYNGPLFDYQHPQYPGVLTEHGINFKAYTDALL